MYTPEGYLYWENPYIKMPQGTHLWEILPDELFTNSTARCSICKLKLIELFIGHQGNDTSLFAWSHNNKFEYPLSCEEVKMNSALE